MEQQTNNFCQQGSASVIGNLHGNFTQTTNFNSIVPPCEPDGIKFKVEKPDANFLGRSAELGQLHELFSSTNQVIVAVSGMGGVGKTELARKFVQSNRNKYSNFIWIDSDKEENIETSFRLLSADYLNFSTINANRKKKQCKSVIDQVLMKLCKRKTFFVYDNVDSNETLRYILAMDPPTGDSSHILMTSRLQNWPAVINVIRLNVWSLTESVDYISKMLNEPSNHSALDKELLVETLQFFPLALRQVTAYIEHQRKSKRKFEISDYRREFETKKAKMLNSKVFQELSFSPYQETTYTTWSVTMNTIEKDKTNGWFAIKILNIMAYLNPDYIPANYFLNLACDDNQHFDNEESEERVNSAFELLTKYCILDRRDRAYSIHRLVQEVIKIKLKESGKEVPTLKEAIECFWKEGGWDETLFQYVTETDYLVRELSSHVETMPPLAYCYHSFGKHTEALQLYKKLFELQQRDLGESHCDTLSTKSKIAGQHFKLEQHVDALRLLYEIYATQRTSLGEGHCDILITKYQLAGQHSRLNQHADALRLYQEIYETQKTSLGESDDETLDTKSKIVQQHICLKQHAEAFRLRWEIYETQRTSLGESHRDTLSTKSVIASEHFNLEQHAESFRLLWEIYETQKTSLGESNDEALDTKSEIADQHFILEQNAEAFRLRWEIYETQRTSLGESHRDTLSTKSKIAVQHFNLRQDGDALRLYKEIHETQRNAFGENDWRTLLTRSKIENFPVRT